MAILLAIVSYALGCLSPGYLLVRLSTGKDLRAAFTGSTGARNAGRVAGRRVAAAVFAADLLKGAAAVGLARAAGVSDSAEAACGFAVVLGHVAPAQLRFRGGRGLSTALGAMAVLQPVAAAACLAAAAVAWLASRSAVAGGLAGAAAAPAAGYAAGMSGAAVGWLLAIGVIIVAAHARRPSPPSHARRDS